MQLLETIDRMIADDGSVFTLRRRGDEWVVFVNERVLMSSRMHHSEEELALQALQRVPAAKRVFIAGLGLGYTLRAALDGVGADARLTVAELVPAVVTWNRTHLSALAAQPLADPRSEVIIGDALDVLLATDDEFDVILLDVDNGPVALSQSSNQRLYSARGLRKMLGRLRKGGVLAVWSAAQNPEFERRLQTLTGNAEVVIVNAHKGSRAKHYVFLATR